MPIRLFIAIFILLLCASVAHADEPMVIKDSDATHYVGKEVEVRGRVVSVITSPLGTAFVNFGKDYPNQTFAGFIAAGSPIATDQRLTMIEGETMSITGKIRLRMQRAKPAEMAFVRGWGRKEPSPMPRLMPLYTRRSQSRSPTLTAPFSRRSAL